MRMKQGAGRTKEEVGQLSAEKRPLPYFCAFNRRSSLTAPGGSDYWYLVGGSVPIHGSISMADDLEVTAGTQKFQKFKRKKEDLKRRN